MRLWYLSNRRAMKAQVSLQNCTCLSEPSQLITWMCWFCSDVSPKGPAWKEVRRKLEKEYRIAKENHIFEVRKRANFTTTLAYLCPHSENNRLVKV